MLLGSGQLRGQGDLRRNPPTSNKLEELMKMVKSLLLGSAAGLVAVAGAQAADLPVKAKPVQYVKICNLYGVGFYYIPGTDMCIKIGGYARFEAAYGVNGSSTNVQGGDLNNRFTNDLWYRV